MVQSVTRGTVDDWRISDILSVMNHHRPNVNEYEENDVCKLLQREDEGKNMIWYRLRKAIHGMEGMRSIWSWHDPLVVWLMYMLIDQRVVFSPMDPVDEKIGEGDEEWKLEEVVPQTRAILRGIIHLAVSSNLAEEKWDGENGHYRQRSQRLLDLK